MRELDMPADDSSATPRSGVSERVSDQNLDREERLSLGDIHSSTPVSPNFSGFTQDAQQANIDSRKTDMLPTYMATRQPINEVVASAFHGADSNMSQELIDLIAQKVVQQMQANGTSSTATQPVQAPTSTLLNHYDTFSQSSTSPSFSHSHISTPPTPQRQSSVLNAHGYETGIRREMSPTHPVSEDERNMDPTESRVHRPVPLRRISTDHDMTVLEKVWGKLFDEKGGGTDRLEVFLRGVATHIIEDYEPKQSLVVTSDKMLKYYEDTKLNEHPEVYPWELVFDDRTSCVSRLYRSSAIKAQHHLVQADTDSRPDAPGLTPKGFATFMTVLIQAHPDQGFERLLRTVREMPINNPDTGDRFPKDLSRRSFPASSNETLAQRLAGSFAEHCQLNVNLRQFSNAESEQSQMSTSPLLSSKRPDPPFPYVEDAIDESELSDSTSRSAQAPSATANNPTETNLETSTSQGKAPESNATSMAPPTEASTGFDGSEVSTPTPSTMQRPLERERNPYVGSVSRGGNPDVSLSSSDEKRRKKVSSTNDGERRRTKSISGTSRSRPPPPIAIHQRDSGAQPDTAELTRARATTVNSDLGGPMHRTRSNSSYAEVQPATRTRRKSAYGNDANVTRYRVKRSPSLSKSTFDAPRTSVSEPKPSNYQPLNMYPNNYPNVPSSRQQYDTRESRRRDRERSKDREVEQRVVRPRGQSMVAQSPTDASYSDEYYRQQGAYPNGTYQPPVGTSYQYPPTAYSGPREARDVRDTRDTRDSRDNRDQQRDSRDTRDSRDSRDYRDSRDSRDFRDPRESRDPRDMRDPRDYRDPRDPRDSQDFRDTRDSRRER